MLCCIIRFLLVQTETKMTQLMLDVVVFSRVPVQEIILIELDIVHRSELNFTLHISRVAKYDIVCGMCVSVQ